MLFSLRLAALDDFQLSCLVTLWCFILSRILYTLHFSPVIDLLVQSFLFLISLKFCFHPFPWNRTLAQWTWWTKANHVSLALISCRFLLYINRR